MIERTKMKILILRNLPTTFFFLNKKTKNSGDAALVELLLEHDAPVNCTTDERFYGRPGFLFCLFFVFFFFEKYSVF